MEGRSNARHQWSSIPKKLVYYQPCMHARHLFYPARPHTQPSIVCACLPSLHGHHIVWLDMFLQFLIGPLPLFSIIIASFSFFPMAHRTTCGPMEIIIFRWKINQPCSPWLSASIRLSVPILSPLAWSPLPEAPTISAARPFWWLSTPSIVYWDQRIIPAMSSICRHSGSKLQPTGRRQRLFSIVNITVLYPWGSLPPHIVVPIAHYIWMNSYASLATTACWDD